MSFDPAERRRTPLAEKLAKQIGRTGPITVSEYMEACLHDPEHGYYRTHAGIGRDFITAPEISQMFGELVGLWCSVVWRQMGSPDPIRLIEVGPGRGTMMRDMLNAFRLVPDFVSALCIRLVETSGPLRTQQQSLLRDVSVPITWLDALPEPAPCASIVVANEFLDALPARQYMRTTTGWAERAVTTDMQGQLQFACGAPPDAGMSEALSVCFPGAREHDVAEVGDFSLTDWLTAQARQRPTAALFVDYGHEQSTIGDTLQAVRQHRYEHPLCSPGEADLTTHVDFERLVRHLTESSHLTCDGPVTQADFLGALGLIERTSRLMATNPAKALEIEAAAQRLLAPNGMGTRFKVIGVRSQQLPPLPGLSAGHLAPSARSTSPLPC
jgi:SAM-dependent MidA family methyltransferase